MRRLLIPAAVIVGLAASAALAADWPMLGRDATRNPVSPEAAPPVTWDVESGCNVRWSAPLGSNSYGDPVVADGFVWVGTNNASLKPGEERIDAAVLMCFRESDGELLYRYVSPRLPQGMIHDWPYGSLACSPLIEGDRMWFTTNRAEVVCLDIGPLHRGEGEPKTVWKLDMIERLGVFPRGSIMNIARFCSPAAYKDWIYVITGNGVDGSHTRVPRPDAPSLVCLEKATGRVVWTDNSPGENILHGQWASPLAAEINGRAQVVAPQGDGWLRSFDAATGELIWKFDMNRKDAKWTLGGRGTRNDILATPVLYENRIYIAGGQHPEHGEGAGRLICIDPTKTGDLSAELAVDAAGEVIPHRRIQAVDPAKGERAVSNPGSGLVWEFTERGDEFEDAMHRSVSSVAVHKGLLVAVDFSGLVHCLDARTGEKHWTHDVFAAVLAAPLIVDDTIYVADEDGDLTALRLTTEKQVLGEISHDGAAYCSPIFANGVLYVTTNRRLYAIRDEQDAIGEGPASTERRPGHWPQWRGPKRDNVSTETGLLQEWPEEGPPLVWRVEGLGEGISPVSVTGGRLFTISRQSETEYVVALDEQTGRSLWSAYLGRTIQQSPLMQWLTQRTPTVNEDRLYAVGGLGDLACLRASDGRELWRVRYEEDLQGKRGPYGFGDRPTVDGDLLIVTVGGSQAPVIALDKHNGEVRWKCTVPEDEHWAYGTGAVAEIHGVRQYVAGLRTTVVGIAVEDGRVLWRHDAASSGLQWGTLTPLVRDDCVLVPLGYGRRILRLRIVRDGDAFEAREVHSARAFLDSFQDGTFLAGDHLYVFGNVAGSYHWKTGEAAWEKRIGSRAAATYADGRVYVRDVEGLVRLFEAGPEELAEKGRFTIPEAARSSGATFPVVAGGRLHLRDNERLFCYDIRADAADRPHTPARTITLSKPDLVELRDRRTSRTGVDRAPDAVFVPTPHNVVEGMLRLAGVAKQDIVYDLGSGDGRVVIAAAKKYGCRAVGCEIDRDLVELSRENVRREQVGELVTIEHADMLTKDLGEASVVTLYLQPELLERLLPQLRKLKPGSRIVSHQFKIPGIAPRQTVSVDSRNGDRHTIYLWTTPLD